MPNIVPLRREASSAGMVKAFDDAFRASLAKCDARGDDADRAIKFERELVSGIIGADNARFIPLRSLCDFAVGFTDFNNEIETAGERGLSKPDNHKPRDPMAENDEAMALFSLAAVNKISIAKRTSDNSVLLFPEFDYLNEFVYENYRTGFYALFKYSFRDDLFWLCRRLLKRAQEVIDAKPRRRGRPRRTDLVDQSQPASARVNRNVKSVSFEIEPDLAEALDEAVKITGMKKARWVRAAFAQAIRDSGGEVPNAELYDRLIKQLREQKKLDF